MILFEKVSKKQFAEAITDMGEEIYERIQLPVRSTAGSAGYDFCSTMDVTLYPGQSVKIPTGIRAKMPENVVLAIFPRSGLGFKYRMQLNNTVGIIDSDYYNSDNEGHIFIKITNDSREGKVLEIKEGEKFAQGIFFPYLLTDNDNCQAARNGGFGSTGA